MEQETQVNVIEAIKEKYGESNLVEMVHAFLSNERQQNQVDRFKKGRVGKFYPSSVGNCKRKIAYQMLGYPGKPASGQGLLIMENGTYFHNRMEDIFERMGIMIAPELSLRDEDLRISGRSDAIIWNFMLEPEEEDGPEIELYQFQKDENGRTVYEDGKPVLDLVYKGPNNHVLIVEFKSAKAKKYNDYIPKTKPIAEHEMQLQLYFYLTGIRKGMVYYENKDNQEQKYHVVEYNEKIVEEVIADIKHVIEHLDNGTMPEREFQPVDVKCRYCDFRDVCYPDMNPVDYDKIL